MGPAPPPWTDHNAGDPGVTVLEVLAYGLALLTAGAAVAAVRRRARRRRAVSARRLAG